MAEKMAFFVLKGEKDRKGNFIACLATKGQKGYRTMAYRWGKDFEQAEAKAAQVNKDWFGITKDQAARIVVSTM